MANFRRFITLLLFAGSLVSFAQDKSHVRSEMVVSTDWLAQHLNDPKLVVIHFADDEKQFNAGHIPGARAAYGYTIYKPVNGVDSELKPVEELVKNFEELGVSNDSRIVIYTTDWPPMAERVYWTLDYLGLAENASVLDGGLQKWKAEKRAVSKESTTPAKGKITPNPRPQVLASFDEVKAATESQTGPLIVDARPESRYTKGHVPGAVSVYWGHVVPKDNPYQLLSADEIEKAYTAAGVAPGAKLITYCEIGWQASHAYFTAKYLGYDVRMYDGSYQEWADVKHAPTVKGDKPR